MRIQVRNNEVLIDGYVNAVERDSKVLQDAKGKFIERIMPKVFQRALDKAKNVKVLLNHDKNRELADTDNGTAKLVEDNIGLRAYVKVQDPYVIQKAKENKLSGWSFGFIPVQENRSAVDGSDIEHREITDLDLLEVSILDDTKEPAYYATSIEMRDSGISKVEFRGGTFDEIEIEKPKIDYSNYEQRLKKIKEEI